MILRLVGTRGMVASDPKHVFTHAVRYTVHGSPYSNAVVGRRPRLSVSYSVKLSPAVMESLHG